jgi:hypothetical protein
MGNKNSGRVSMMTDHIFNMKICTKCHIKKPLSEFSIDSRRQTARAICKECSRKYGNKYYHNKTTRGIKNEL